MLNIYNDLFCFVVEVVRYKFWFFVRWLYDVMVGFGISDDDFICIIVIKSEVSFWLIVIYCFNYI